MFHFQDKINLAFRLKFLSVRFVFCDFVIVVANVMGVDYVKTSHNQLNHLTFLAMVKDCDIGDASRGFLSSYAYIILMIHYLQQVSVLPVLQELHEESQQPENLCEGFNTWFQDDPHAIKRLFTCENNKSLSRLWIGFLQYYTECFHFEMITVQIRQRDTLMKCDKFGWSSKPICIEDPFELTHNLGRNVSPENIHCITEQFRLYLGVTTANTFSISRGEK